MMISGSARRAEGRRPEARRVSGGKKNVSKSGGKKNVSKYSWNIFFIYFKTKHSENIPKKYLSKNMYLPVGIK